ncbi:MAG: penicillin-binding protein 1C [Bacteroidales bacterium]|nr:penicillin-binding protein 1C [Bacteroidales bacterium]
MKRAFWTVLALLILLFLLIPDVRFRQPASTVVFSSEQELLGARIAPDGQWRFPPSGRPLPDKYVQALIQYEDRWFRYHPGVNPVAMGKALVRNIRHGRNLSGGSTLTMQVARLSRGQQPRNVGEKFLETFMALKLERLKNKREILALYAAHAPFGSNVVGLEAASWRYFHCSPEDLSWAEAATLAVLPNAPSLLYPGRRDRLLKDKRDRLLAALHRHGKMDDTDYRLALLEPMPERPLPLPETAVHWTDRIHREQPGRQVQTSLHYELQREGVQVALRHHSRLSEQGIRNLAALIVDVESGSPLLYIGNTPGLKENGGQVDMIRARRSTGSILKPLLYAAMLNEGEILPRTLIRDTPINYTGYMPQNFDHSYSGAVPADQALSRSLNVPAVEMLQQYGQARFLDVLKACGFTTFRQSAAHYGLSLILGGGECRLEELAACYAAMARRLNHYGQADYEAGVPFSAAACWFTVEAMRQLTRPEDRAGWQYYNSARPLAWKTGTSFGFRDAWAVGLNPRYVVAVWVGNADGEGRPDLTGIKAAAPLLFDLVELLPADNEWFQEPLEELTYAEICPESGYKASACCPHREMQPIPAKGERTGICPYHRIVHLSADGRYQVRADCYPVSEMRHDSCFVLPPAMEWYYRKRHPEYRSLPPMMPGCEDDDRQQMEIVSPKNLSEIYIPVDFDGQRKMVVFEAAHSQPGTTLYWHLDDCFLGSTRQLHQMGVAPEPGWHRLTLIDEQGRQLSLQLRFVDRGQN